MMQRHYAGQGGAVSEHSDFPPKSCELGLNNLRR